MYDVFLLIYIAREAFQVTLWRALRFFFLFFLPNIGKYLGSKMLGDTADYFRKIFWDSMDGRAITKMKRGDLIDSLLQLKNEKTDNTDFREYSTNIYTYKIFHFK